MAVRFLDYGMVNFSVFQLSLKWTNSPILAEPKLMGALGNNILVRFLTNDDATQAERVYRLFRQAEANREVFFVLVVLELFWVLESAYGIARQEILDAVDALMQVPVLTFDSKVGDVVQYQQ